MYLSFNSFSKAKSMTIVSVIEDRDYFLWQQEVQCFHMAENYSHLNYEVIILREKDNPSDWSKHISKIANTSLYKLTEEEINSFKSYKCSYKPYGLYLRNSDSSKNVLENIFAIDSDVILNRDLDYDFLLEDNESSAAIALASSASMSLITPEMESLIVITEESKESLRSDIEFSTDSIAVILSSISPSNELVNVEMLLDNV